MNIIKELRRKKGIQQKELAIEIGVSQPTISDWESGRKDPTGDRLKKLSEFFGVDELVIMGRGVIDLTNNTSIPKTIEARLISGSMDKMTKEQREQVVAVVKAMFSNHPELFDEGEKKNDTGL